MGNPCSTRYSVPLASLADHPALRSCIDAESLMERAYPDAPANKLNLPADLKTHLENEAQQALAAA
jgi:uncharacterized membrane protein YebE (DUF533 family)